MGKSRGRLFLLEMIIIILFFAVAAAVCMNLFAKAREEGARSADLTMAVTQAQYAAETFKSTGGDMRKTGELLFAAESGGEITLCYDDAWNSVPPGEDAAYCLTMTEKNAEGLRAADVTVSAAGEEIYRIETAIYGDGI